MTTGSPQHGDGARVSEAEAQVIALDALVWLLGEPDRADRFLSLTGLSPDELRASVSEPETMAAVVEFLAGHEPDLVAAAAALELTPQQIAACVRVLSSSGQAW